MINSYQSLESISVAIPQSVPTTTTEDLIRNYKDDCELKGMSAESIRRYISSIKIFIQYLNDNGMSSLDADRDSLRSFIEYLRKENKL
jgi:site-specific recombinase XerD